MRYLNEKGFVCEHDPEKFHHDRDVLDFKMDTEVEMTYCSRCDEFVHGFDKSTDYLEEMIARTERVLEAAKLYPSLHLMEEPNYLHDEHAMNERAKGTQLQGNLLF